MSRVNWSRGWVRLYILWLVGWVVYWFLYIPVREALTHPDSWAAGGRVLRVMASPGLLPYLVAILLLPLAVYLVARCFIAVGRWVVRGFAQSSEAEKS